MLLCLVDATLSSGKRRPLIGAITTNQQPKEEFHRHLTGKCEAVNRRQEGGDVGTENRAEKRR